MLQYYCNTKNNMNKENSEKNESINEIKQEEQNELKDEDISKIDIANITIEQLLTDLRIKKNWTYLEVVQELTKLGVIVDEKTVKKCEFGLVYPELDIIYKLSELYFIPSEVLVTAKNNSYTKGYNAINQRIIKWICYLTGLSFKVAFILMYSFIFLVLIWSFIFFYSNGQRTLEILRSRQ